MEWEQWSCLDLTQRAQLPAQPGIYVVVDAEAQVWYVGQSVNLNTRWNGSGHHRYKQLSRTNKKRVYKIYWQVFPVEQLDAKEQLYIDRLKPHLNYSQVKRYARKAIQPKAEISRLLKTINQKTMLFPDVRSVVLGYYREIDANETGLLQAFLCVVIAVSINDHDRVILNSYKKSYSKKGNYLKDCWCVHESDCGSTLPDAKLALIPSFRLGHIAYEFVCHGAFIEQCSKQPTCLHTVEIEGQTVLALQDLKLLGSLLADQRYPPSSSETYLHYRAAALQPIRQVLPELSGA